MSLTGLSLAAGYVYSKKVEKEIDDLLEKEDYESLVDLHQRSASLKELRRRRGVANFSDIQSLAYSYGFQDKDLDNIYREYMKQKGLDDTYEHL